MYSSNILKDIENIDTVYIAGHTNPDGDAVGSTFAFALAMNKLGKKPVILLESYDSRFNVLKGKEYVYTGDYSHLKPEIMFAIDCGADYRLGRAQEVFARANMTYNIDHHISNDNFAQNNIVNGGASSASEIVYEIISKFVDIDIDIANAVYTGILLDTGGFMHSCTSKRTHEIAGELVKAGVDTSYIHSKMLKEHTFVQAKVFGRAMDNLSVDSGIAYTYLTNAEIKSMGATSVDFEGIVEYILNMNDIKASVFVTERDNDIIRLSFRSKAIDVNQAAAVFGGGGHEQAAGATVKNGELKDILYMTVNDLKSRLDSYEE